MTTKKPVLYVSLGSRGLMECCSFAKHRLFFVSNRAFVEERRRIVAAKRPPKGRLNGGPSSTK